MKTSYLKHQSTANSRNVLYIKYDSDNVQCPTYGKKINLLILIYIPSGRSDIGRPQ
jgi:hypothetical protein